MSAAEDLAVSVQPEDPVLSRSGRTPLLASIGTVLIDSFESPPRPRLDISTAASSSKLGPLTTSPTSTVPLPWATSDSRPSSPSPLNPTAHRRPKPVAPITSAATPQRSSSRPNTGSSTSTIASTFPLSTDTRSDSGVYTPQRSFDSPLPTPSDEVWEVLGGGGMYALVGARIWLDPSVLRCIVDRASSDKPRDFPRELEEQLNVFGEEIWCWNEGTETRATRSRLKYEGGVRYFEFTVPPPRRTIDSLKDTPVFGAEYLHVSPPNSPKDLAQILEQLRVVRNSEGSNWSPKIVFEPHPLSCKPEQRAALEEVAPFVDVLSPNHEELLAFYSQSCGPLPDPNLPSLVEPLVQHLLHDIGVGEDCAGVVAIRCGRMGSCIGTRRGGIRWIPAYFEEEEQHRVVDVSGAGNAFLGGYVAGLHLSDGDPYEAALYATVSASFMVEQICLPEYDPQLSRWNSEAPLDRIQALRRRLNVRGTEREVDPSF